MIYLDFWGIYSPTMFLSCYSLMQGRIRDLKQNTTDPQVSIQHQHQTSGAVCSVYPGTLHVAAT